MAKKMLLTTNLTIHEISSKVGYDNVNEPFYSSFPKEYRTHVRAVQTKGTGGPTRLALSLSINLPASMNTPVV